MVNFPVQKQGYSLSVLKCVLFEGVIPTVSGHTNVYRYSSHFTECSQTQLHQAHRLTHTSLLSPRKVRQWQNPMQLWNPLQPSVNDMYQVLEHFSTVMNLYTASQQSCPLTKGNGSPLGRVWEQSGQRWNVRGATCRVLSVPARMFSGYQAKVPKQMGGYIA